MTGLHVLEDEPEKKVRWQRFAIGLVIAMLLQGGGFFGISQIEPPKKERRSAVIMTFVKPKPKPKPKPKIEKPKPKPKKKKKKKKKRKRRKKKKPKPKPKPKPQAKQAQKKPPKPPKKPPPLMTGLTLKSTVKGGKGPVMQVGNTMYGKPKSKLKAAVTEKAAVGKKTQEGSATPVYVGPKVLKKVRPKYTAEGLDEGIEGQVILLIKLNNKGKIVSSKIIKGLGYGLDQNAQNAVKRWVFAAATRGGKAVASSKKIKVYFVIE